MSPMIAYRILSFNLLRAGVRHLHTNWYPEQDSWWVLRRLY